MVNYTEYEIINEMIIQTEDLYLNCLECKYIFLQYLIFSKMKVF